MNILSTLNEELRTQSFADDKDESLMLVQGQQIAQNYANIENSIAVLSDLKSNKSYIYNGGTAKQLGIATKNSTKTIDSIWEEDIFNRIHPDDLIAKHLLELHFFHLLPSLPPDERSDYHIVSNMRIANSLGEYISIIHRMFYVSNCPLGNIWLSLCLYNFPYTQSVSEVANGIILNSATGTIIKPDNDQSKNILSSREKEILRLIENGKMSKEIASLLYISKNTVNRHRQNILEKLRVKNSIEACRIARLMGLI